MKAYKLVRKMKDGFSPLFINQKSRMQIGEWMQAEKCYNREKSGFKYRPFWHCTAEPLAPHLKVGEGVGKNRVWVEIEMEDYEAFERPEHQGGKWFLADRIKIIKEI